MANDHDLMKKNQIDQVFFLPGTSVSVTFLSCVFVTAHSSIGPVLGPRAVSICD
jgi:hypothetical protein